MLKLLINLDKSQDRLEKVNAQFNAIGINVNRVSAVDGRLLSNEEISKITYPITDVQSHIKFTRSLSKSEIGCFLSHKKCWQILVDSEEEWALIFEDDLRLSKRAATYMSDESWIPNEVKLLQLHSHEPSMKLHCRKEIIKLDEKNYLISPLDKAHGTQCYFIHRDVAKLALEKSKILPAPVDDFLFSLWFDVANTFKVWRLQPTVVTQTLEDSDIGNRRKDSLKSSFWIRHGIRRTLKRFRLKLFVKIGKSYKSYFE